MQHKAFLPHVRMMLLLPVVLLLLLQGSFAKTVTTVLPQYTFEKRNNCPVFAEKETQATSSFDCAAKMIDTNYHAFRYHADGGQCKILEVPGIHRIMPCWKLVSRKG